jgi:hypothetical protein
MKFTTTEFVGRRLEIDGNVYEQCKFRACDLVFSGKGLIRFVDCTFKDCRLHFEGPVGLTLSVMRAFHQAGFADVIERTFENIRRSRPGTKFA